ncbi:hypothetical protein Vadar_016401 [Vaccinium darrowii]|uniref:Uncharacterized protein n=1 Tax=Vaccinium darrowii TaxID=229202 RepID=A0ACB7Z4E2_9ERIC|nr:hypothetical protein Vadar_016401 [Vaccinium darrowii]
MVRRRTQAEIQSQERFERLEKTIADLTTLVRDLQQNQQPAPPPPPPPVQIQQPQPVPPPQQPQNVEPQTAAGLNLKEFLKLKPPTFEGGINPAAAYEWNMVRPLRLATYAEVLDRALLVEQGLEDVRRISEFKKRKANVGKTAGGGMYKRQNTGITTQRNQGRTVPVCAICGKGHSGTCWYSATKCYNCGQAGHIQKNCPQRGTGANAIPVKPVAGPKANTNQKVGSNQKPARAFALTPGDPRNTESVVAGTIFICSTPAYVLLDSGSTHSFISDHLALKLHKRPEPLEYELVVSQPMNSRTICTSI